ncbi:MAG: DNA/RNA nuclease SfsA, partial [Candidatus Thorarchaeota archaeon]
MLSEGEVSEALLIDRPNRFLGRVELDGKTIEVFIPNPGRMYELMIPGKQVFIRRKSGPNRKTQYDMIGVWHKDVLISIDTNLPNRFMKESLLHRELEWFLPYDAVTPEPRV